MASYLLSIKAVRDKCTPVFQLALENKLENFDSHFDDPSKLDECIDFIVKLIKRDFGDNYSSIPPHGRWQHLEAGNKPRVSELISKWSKLGVDDIEVTRRLVDLFVVSVFLDAGAGNAWSYTEPGSGDKYTRSEGLAVASFYVYEAGEFSNSKENPYEVKAASLQKITEDQFKNWLQVSDTNPLTGFEGRLNLLHNLGKSLETNSRIFGEKAAQKPEYNRPGNLVDYLLSLGAQPVDMADLWNALMEGFNGIWSSRLELDGVSLGDAWKCKSVEKIAAKNGKISVEDAIVPFHKLTQWLTYSLLVPLTKYGHFEFANQNLLTGLPEYRNGGLLIDFGLLTIKPAVLAKGTKLSEEISSDTSIPSYLPDDDLVVEWRCCTVGFLDYILPIVNGKLGAQLELAQLIEAGSWKAGREIAALKRPSTKGPPIALHSDGTVF